MSGMFVFGSHKTEAAVRPAAVAGSFYPSDKDELTREMKEFFAQAKVTPSDSVAAVIVPHAGYVFSAKVAATAFAAIPANRKYEHVFLLGPSHYEAMDYASVNNEFNAYDTPMGRVEVDTALCSRLIADNDYFKCNPAAHDREHCIEVQLPFLMYRLAKMPPIVPIIIGTESASIISRIAKALKPYFNDRNLFVISSDFSHYPSYDDAEEVDHRTGDAVATGSPEAFIKALRLNHDDHIPHLVTSACGESAILALLYMSTGSNITIKHLKYLNSGDEPLYGEHSRVVGYHAFAFLRNQTKAEFSLTDSEKLTLLKIARKAIAHRLNGDTSAVYSDSDLTPALKTPCGAFVTLNEDKSLRGCIGHFGGDSPLYKTVVEMAQAAAFEDYRFHKLKKDELDKVEIEISVLTPRRRINSIDEFTLGKQGIYVKKGYHAGTFLPQVADEVNWTKEQLVDHCAHDKAGLDWDEWRTAELYTYEAIVFGEKDDK
jgi:AmmeMemoRadiSam system protein B/AmmeMemoRadiSam system protein A